MKKRRKLAVARQGTSAAVYLPSEYTTAELDQFERQHQQRVAAGQLGRFDSQESDRPFYRHCQPTDWVLVIAKEKTLVSSKCRYGVVQAWRLDAEGKLLSGDLSDVDWTQPWAFLTKPYED